MDGCGSAKRPATVEFPALIGGPDVKKPRFATASEPLPPQSRWPVLTAKFDRAGGETKKLGLRDLFHPSPSSPSSTQEPREHGGDNDRRATARRFPIQQQVQQQPGDFFTFRLEHREGGIMARHVGEERILLFRSDRPGAIAKIIYSSTDAPASKLAAAVVKSDSAEEQVKTCGEFVEDELKQMAQAKIHVLDVKEQYRGRDLGGLLFSEAVLSLRDHYGHIDEHIDEDIAVAVDQDESARATAVRPLSSSVRCQLDAEEDVQRHNKLVGFYEALGCSIKPKAKIQYLNNNDGETYRKVPMQMALPSAPPQKKLAAVADAKSCPSTPHRRHVTNIAKSLVGQRGGFLPIQLLESSGRKIDMSLPRRTDWLIVDDGDGGIQLRTTQGHRIVTTHDGRVVTLSSEDDSDIECSSDDGSTNCSCPGCSSEEWGTFNLCRIPDSGPAIVSDSECTDDEAAPPGRKELWMLKSSHGTYLTADPISHALSCTTVPTFWQANNDDLSLTCTTDTPPRRIHYRHIWKTQCVDYVRRMEEKYLQFKLCHMDIWDALDKAKALPCHPFRVEEGAAGPSLRTFCFRAAEAMRLGGYPDWMQMAALLHELGRVVSLLDSVTTAEAKLTGYDWTLSCRSRVVGCAPPEYATFREFHHLNPDSQDANYNTALGMYEEHCGLDNVLLTWSGPEYMHHMLQRNGASLPEEGLAVMRLFCLRDWHEHGEYGHLANSADEDSRLFVSDFDYMRRKALRECKEKGCDDLSDAECKRLWDCYFSNILKKYGCGGRLLW